MAMLPVLDERVATPTHRSRRTHQRTGANKRKCPIPTAHFMAFFGAGAAAFAFLMAFVTTNACSLAVLLTTFIAFMAFGAAAFFAFAMTRREVSKRALEAGKMKS